MKLFNFFTVGALANEVTLSRTRRDVAYSFSGEEAADFYSDILADISGKSSRAQLFKLLEIEKEI